MNAPGLYDATIESWTDLGVIQTPYGKMPKVEFRFRIQCPHGVFFVNHRYGKNFSPKSFLRRDIENLLSEVPGPDFDLGRLVGVECQVNLAADELTSKKLRVRGLFPARETDLGCILDAVRRFAEARSPRK